MVGPPERDYNPEFDDPGESSGPATFWGALQLALILGFILLLFLLLAGEPDMWDAVIERVRNGGR